MAMCSWSRSGSQNVTDVFTGFGERQISAEEVAARVVDEVREYLAAGVPVGPHLADQMLLPMALAGGGTFITMALTEHAKTNMEIIRRFAPLEFAVTHLDNNRCRVSISGA